MSFGFVDLPLEMFYVMFAIFGAILAVAFVSRQPILVMFAGIFLLIIFIPVNTVIAATNVATVNSVSSGGSIEYDIQNAYTPTANLNVTSSGTDVVMGVSSGSSALTVRSGSATIVTQIAAAESSLLDDKSFNQVVFSESKTGSPTGTATIGTFDGNSNNVVTTCGTQDVSTLTGSQADYTIDCGSVQRLNYGGSPDRFGYKYTGGDASNLVNIFSDGATQPFDGTNSVRVSYTSSWQSPVTTSDLRMSLNMVTSAAYLRDGSGISYWVNNSNNESPVCISADLGAVSAVNGFRLTHEDLTRVVNSVNYYSSSDASTWTFRQPLSLDDSTTERTVYLLDDTYTFRYHRLCIDDYGSGVARWQVNELDFVFADSEIVGSSVTETYTYEDDVIDVDPTVKVLSTMFGALMIIFGAWMFRDGDD